MSTDNNSAWKLAHSAVSSLRGHPTRLLTRTTNRWRAPRAGSDPTDRQDRAQPRRAGVDAEEVSGENGSSELRTDISRLSHRRPRFGWQRIVTTVTGVTAARLPTHILLREGNSLVGAGWRRVVPCTRPLQLSVTASLRLKRGSLGGEREAPCGCRTGHPRR